MELNCKYGSVTRLRQFYRRFGFGRNKDYRWRRVRDHARMVNADR